MKTIASLTLAIAALTAGMAHADDSVPLNQGWRVGIGGAYIHLNTKTDDFTGQFTPPGLSLEVKSASTLFLSLSKTMTDHIDVTLLGGLPPLHHVYAKGNATAGSQPYDGVEIGSARQLAPTVMVDYSLFDAGTAFRPYFGAGINFTHFYDQKSTGNSINGGTTTESNSDSLGPAFAIGARYNWSPRWSLNAELVRPIVQSQLTATTDGVVRTTNIDFNPLVTVVSVEYTY